MGEYLNSFPKIKKETRLMASLSILIAYNTGSQSYSREVNKRRTNIQGRSQRIPICRWYNSVYIRYPRESTRKPSTHTYLLLAKVRLQLPMDRWQVCQEIKEEIPLTTSTEQTNLQAKQNSKSQAYNSPDQRCKRPFTMKTLERETEHKDGKMERPPMLTDRKNWYCKNGYATKNNLQI